MKASTPAILAWLTVLAFGSALAFADPPAGRPPGGPHGGPPPIERLAADLGLDATQQAQVKQIFDAEHTKMEAERANFEASGTRPSREEMHARHEQMQAELRARLAGVLTAEQLKKFDELRARQRPHGPPPGESDAPPPQ